MPRNRVNPQRGCTFILPCNKEHGLPGEVTPGTRAWVADDMWQPMDEIPIRLRSGRYGVVYYVPAAHVLIDKENSFERASRLAVTRSKKYRQRPGIRDRENARRRTPQEVQG